MAPHRPEIEALLARVRRYTSNLFDGGLDADLLDGCFGRLNWPEPLRGGLSQLRLLSSSDGAAAFVECALPGCRAGFQPCIGDDYRGHIIRVTATEAHLVRDARGRTPALAIITAALEALLHQAPDHDHR